MQLHTGVTLSAKVESQGPRALGKLREFGQIAALLYLNTYNRQTLEQ